ncbi:MAG: hypothetical protein M3Q71_12830, partial [Chloroflexota bacterium]|nr:hypothetical protein [Chloroflexota bacterium]
MGDQCKMAGPLNAWLRVPRNDLESVINFEGDFVRSPFYHNEDRFADSSTHWSRAFSKWVKAQEWESFLGRAGEMAAAGGDDSPAVGAQQADGSV